MDIGSISRIFLIYSAIFGNKRVLRPGKDDEKLEQILQLIANDDSDVEMSDDENENMDNLVEREDEIIDEELQSSSDEEEQDRIPLSVLREKLRTAKETSNPSQRQFWRRNDILHLQILKVPLVNAAHSFAMVGLQNRI
ncbi:unnamed protein product [Acanthoscelides obtectus]|uniref:Uncharacterized protein n=1 Tax=Acanthoscelides obtectus TaxID=200917 RepID=A0A9P0M2A0_ACAOB|nr:unnamed protein product [Acanthoscelides obtectus]CAK1642154.1 hypothetical protein AOBTE_LOCUS12852 [Acanthoscelides obtectus]